MTETDIFIGQLELAILDCWRKMSPEQRGRVHETTLRLVMRANRVLRVETYPCGCQGTPGNRCPVHSCP